VPLALLNIPSHLGYLVLFALVGAESTGVPVPGETALITAAVLARHGRLNIALVIAIAAVAAMVGDNLGYLIGRTGGRRLLERPGLLEHHRSQIIDKGEPFFERHGPKAVFLGRWVAGLRIAAAWLAGINACGGRCSSSGTRSGASRGRPPSACSPTPSGPPPSGSSRWLGSPVWVWQCWSSSGTSYGVAIATGTKPRARLTPDPMTRDFLLRDDPREALTPTALRR
jgi:membrane protein YqaA with SNARE-associated domain